MYCFYHKHLFAAAKCKDCEKRLCRQCASQFTIPICITCITIRNEIEEGAILKELSLTFIIGLFLTFVISQLRLNSSQSVYIIFLMFYAYSGIVSGWLTLNKITPKTFLYLPLIGWVFYFVLKFVLSFWVGLIMLPVRTFRNIRRVVQISQLR